MRNFILILLLTSFTITINAQSNTCPNGFTCGSKFVDPRDGISYPTVQIGTQCWMTVNLRATKYLNGDSIQHITNGTTWSGMTTGAWCDYNNAASNGNTYGHLYNRYAVTDGRSICPRGWYIPTYNEWNILINFVEFAFPSCKVCTETMVLESSSSLWTGSTGGNNASGFSALPSGYDTGGSFGEQGSGTGIWSSSKYYLAGYPSLTGLWYICLTPAYYSSEATMQDAANNQANGLSVRCIKDN